MTAAVLNFLTKKAPNTFGVPEIINSHNGKKYVAKINVFPFVKCSELSKSVRAQRDQRILPGDQSSSQKCDPSIYRTLTVLCNVWTAQVH